MNQHMQRPALEATDLFGHPTKLEKRRGTFTDNMKLPVHRWFRYSAGFSAEWCEQVMRGSTVPPTAVLDPFAGSATTLLAAQRRGIESHGFEAHGFITRVALAKLSWDADPADFQREAAAVLAKAREIATVAPPTSSLMAKCFEAETLADLARLRDAFIRHPFRDDRVRDLVWLAISAILRECSHVGTAQWQYVLPNKRKAKVRNPFEAFTTRCRDIYSDMVSFAERPAALATIYAQDARSPCEHLAQGHISTVITSPPYPNNYDYADATRLEMSFWGEVSAWSDLHQVIRRHLIVSCSQHSSAEHLSLDEVLESPLLDPIRTEVETVCRELAVQREQKAGKKSYHTMVAAYFRDLSAVWHSLRFHVMHGGECYFVVGDSAPYGVYVPVDRWLGELALAAGFRSWEFEQFRERNMKWKNRKHRVPLKEGLLRVGA